MSFSHPSWSFNTNIYEVNLRQYTSEGTFKAFEKELPRLSDMGVEILWLMPITPISVEGRKGTLGSYYAASDYSNTNPEFGSIEDLKQMIKTAHQFNMKVIIDWVANHTGNDHIWISLHPDFFNYNENGIVHPHGWEDVSELNFNNDEMIAAMIAAMGSWIETCDIDGFRCDMAHLVPLSFWTRARMELDTRKKLFWLAECEEATYHEAFDATYTWEWMHKTEEFCKGNIGLKELRAQLEKYENNFPKDAFRTYFTSNHDENSWNGTEYEKYGPAVKLLGVFSCTWNGIPMIYSGQEMPNLKRLKFFDKDTIELNDNYELHDFYKTLFSLRKKSKALSAGDHLSTRMLSFGDNLFSFIRKQGEEEVIVILNFSSEGTLIALDQLVGMYKEIFSGKGYMPGDKVELEGWGYIVLEKS